MKQHLFDPALISQDPQKVIDMLRAEGYRVNVVHARVAKLPAPPVEPNYKLKEMALVGLTPDERGGYTTITILKDNMVVATGQAECSRVDNFTKKLGLIKALGRAMGEFEKRVS